jgi:hypothetical protein
LFRQESEEVEIAVHDGESEVDGARSEVEEEDELEEDEDVEVCSLSGLRLLRYPLTSI